MAKKKMNDSGSNNNDSKSTNKKQILIYTLRHDTCSFVRTYISRVSIYRLHGNALEKNLTAISGSMNMSQTLTGRKEARADGWADASENCVPIHIYIFIFLKSFQHWRWDEIWLRVVILLLVTLSVAYRMPYLNFQQVDNDDVDDNNKAWQMAKWF